MTLAEFADLLWLLTRTGALIFAGYLIAKPSLIGSYLGTIARHYYAERGPTKVDLSGLKINVVLPEREDA
jgi:hypothetical protein